MEIINLNESLNGLFLLILAYSGGYVSTVLGCQFRNSLKTNLISKYFLTFLIVYFSINFTDKKKVNPFYNLVKSFIIMVLFIIVSRMNIYFSFSILILLFISLFIRNLKGYDNLENNKKNETLINNIDKIVKYLIFTLIIIGFIQYFITKKQEYGKNFDLIKFAFGKPNCDSAIKFQKP